MYYFNLISPCKLKEEFQNVMTTSKNSILKSYVTIPTWRNKYKIYTNNYGPILNILHKNLSILLPTNGSSCIDMIQRKRVKSRDYCLNGGYKWKWLKPLPMKSRISR